MLSLIPISDANPTRRFPTVTVALIVANVLSFFAEPSFGGGVEGSRYFFENAPVPCQLAASCPVGVDLGGILVRIPERGPIEFLVAVVVSTFLHAGWLHIIGNMLFLWVFGNNIEDYLGRVKFLVFYLLGGIAAAFAHILTHASSVLPTVGASGAVAAVMGAYLVLYPKARVNVLVPIFFFFSVIQMSAIAVLGLWFVYQFFIGLQEASGATAVAWTAHVGGFVFGVVVIYLLGGRPQRPSMVWRPEWRY
ncbi:MAG TPA: rhomboid family intramembrane serine protease [Actinomycetota bacterium]|nr:rhomboid family intramembrane serine protease [Actinomycetota bacterium]